MGSSSLRSDDAVFVCGSLCSPPGKAFHILQKPLRLLLADSLGESVCVSGGLPLIDLEQSNPLPCLRTRIKKTQAEKGVNSSTGGCYAVLVFATRIDVDQVSNR